MRCMNSSYLFRAHKQQVLNGMCKPWCILIITEVPYIHVHSRTSFVRIRIVYQQYFQLIWQLNNPI